MNIVSGLRDRDHVSCVYNMYRFWYFNYLFSSYNIYFSTTGSMA